MDAYNVKWRRTLANPKSDYDRGVVEYGNGTYYGNTEQEAIKSAIFQAGNAGTWNVYIEEISKY